MSHSCFTASALVETTCVGMTLHRLEFPANVRVHMQVSLKVESPACLLYARDFTATTLRVANRISQLFKELLRLYGARQDMST